MPRLRNISSETVDNRLRRQFEQIRAAQEMEEAEAEPTASAPTRASAHEPHVAHYFDPALHMD